MFPSENDSQLGDVLVAAEPVGPLRGMSARRTLRGRRARATRPRCSTRVKGVFVVREDRRVDDLPWGAHVDDGSIFRYSGFDDTVAVWAGADAVAQDWWNDSALRRPHGEWVTEAHSLVSDLSQMGQPAIVDIIQALVDQGASDNELDFVGAGPLEDLLSPRRTRSRLRGRGREASAAAATVSIGTRWRLALERCPIRSSRSTGAPRSQDPRS